MFLGGRRVVVRPIVGIWHDRNQLVVHLDKYPVVVSVIQLLAHKVLESFVELQLQRRHQRVLLVEDGFSRLIQLPDLLSSRLLRDTPVLAPNDLLPARSLELALVVEPFLVDHLLEPENDELRELLFHVGF